LKNKVCPKVAENRVGPKDRKSKVGSRVTTKSFEPEVIECKSEGESEDDSVELTDNILVISKNDCDPSDSRASEIEAHIANNKTCLDTAADAVSSAKKNVNTATSSTEIKNDETNEIIDKTMKAAKSRRIYLSGKRFVVQIDESPSATKKQCITDIGLNGSSSSSSSLKECTASSLDNIQTSPEKRNLFESMTIESAEQAVTGSNTISSVVTRARSTKTDNITRPNYTDPDSDMDDDDDPDDTDVGMCFKNDSEEAGVNLNNSKVQSKKLRNAERKVVIRQDNKTLKALIGTTATLKLDATFKPRTEVDNASIEGISESREGEETDSLSRSIRSGKSRLRILRLLVTSKLFNC